MKKNLISLFAGAGGLDLGLELAGFNSLVINELEPKYCETLRRNKILSKLDETEVAHFITEALEQKCFKRIKNREGDTFFDRLRNVKKKHFLQNANIIQGDVRTIPTTRFKQFLPVHEELYAIAGGPPCQPFSKAGKQKSLDCTKNGDLFYEFVRLVADLQPKWFIFENVKGITFTKTDVLYAVCKQCNSFEIAPFKIRQNWLNNHDIQHNCSICNADNIQWRIKNEAGGSLNIILNEFRKLGYNCSHKVLNAADFGAPQIRERLFIIGNRNGTTFEWPIATHKKESLMKKASPTLFDSLEKIKIKPWKSMFCYMESR